MATSCLHQRRLRTPGLPTWLQPFLSIEQEVFTPRTNKHLGVAVGLGQ